MKHKTIQLSQYRYHLKSWGCESSPPLIFLHGFMGSADDFDAVVKHLSAYYFCIGIDLPGHGKTEVLGNDACYRMEAIAASLIQLLDTLALPPVHLLGYSMGGRVALYLAIGYPTYFQSVILESASPGLATESERCDRLQQDDAIAKRLEQEDFESFLAWWYGRPLFQSLREHPTYGDMLERRRQNHPSNLARSLRQLSTGRQPSLWSQLSRMTGPCLWLVGGLDQKFVDIGYHASSVCPTLQLQVLPSCGHSVHQEDPRLFAQAVRRFLGHKKTASA